MPENDERLCPRCGTPFEPGQAYCLECGLRLEPEPGLVAALARTWQERLRWYPGDWIWPVLLGLLIAIAGGTAAVLVNGSRGGTGPIVATHGGRPHEPTTPSATATVALPTVPRGTPTTAGPPTTPSTPPPATTTARPRASGLAVWPARRNGYTVVLESIPARAGRGFAVARARAAARSGLPQVGVLNSSRYASLHPGFWVVFSGIYASQAQADAAKARAAGEGFAAAYPRQITR